MKKLFILMFIVLAVCGCNNEIGLYVEPKNDEINFFRIKTENIDDTLEKVLKPSSP